MNIKLCITHIKRGFIVASLLCFWNNAIAQSKQKKLIQPIYFVETISSPGTIAVDANGNQLTPSKIYNYQLYLQHLNTLKFKVHSIHINYKKLGFTVDSTISHPKCIGITNALNDSLCIKPNSSNAVIKQINFSSSTIPKRPRLQRLAIGIKQKSKLIYYTFYIPITTISPLVEFQ